MAVVFLIALGVRLAYVSRVPPRMTPDSADYLTLARNLAAHRVFSLNAGQPTIRRAPGYPVFLVLAGAAPRAVQSVLDALPAAMICAIAARRRWAVAAALVWAAHPGAIVYANSILSETLFAFLLTVAVGLLAVR